MEEFSGSSPASGLLLDSNLVVLFIVGAVNPKRIRNFKRTSAYDPEAYTILVGAMTRFTRIYTVAQVMAEVSNLTDLSGAEKSIARRILAETITKMEEPHVPSAKASTHPAYAALGLTDAAISLLAREKNCTVLTDDLDLYLSLASEGVMAVNFTHLRERRWGI